MILVNTPGSWDHVYSPLLHSEWEGCTPTDLIFPFFLLIMGVGAWYSFKKYDNKLSTELWIKILKRSFLIFLIGILLTNFPFYDKNIEDWRVMGVLQRIAIVYLIGAPICKAIPSSRLHWVAGMILLGYWGLILIFGGSDPYSKETTLARGIDFAILISSTSSVSIMIFGYIIGSYINRSNLQWPALFSLVIIGICGVVFGLFWDKSFPIIKGLLWTSSYVVYSVGIAIVIFAFILWIIEKKGITRWANAFVVFGINPLLLYALSILIAKSLWMIKFQFNGGLISAYEWLYQVIYVPISGNLLGSLFFAITYVVLIGVIALLLYRKGVYVKV